MRSTGIIRPVDKNGRVVIPMDLRRQFDIEDDVDSFEIFVEDDKIILKKYSPYCIFCGQPGDTVKMGGYDVCISCIDKLNDIKESEVEISE